MKTNAEKIAAWREDNPGVRLTVATVKEACGLANLRNADLQNADLRNANLRNADLQNANLRNANLRNANLRNADLRDANLWGADLRDANLWGADLWGANLWGADLRDANLRGANLWGAHLRGADLRDADLRGGMPISTPSGDGYLLPTPDGWRITIGCWRDHTLDDLRALIEDRAEWPEATGAERERRRPILAAVLTLAEAHAAYHSTLIPALAEKWDTKVEGVTP